jgi:hypothetical protein
VSDILFNGLEYATRSVQTNQKGLKLNGTQSFWFMLLMLTYWAEVYICTIKKNAEVLVVVSKEIGLEVTADKTEGKRQLGRPKRRWEYNIKTDLQEVGWCAWTASFIYNYRNSSDCVNDCDIEV